jgi:flagellar biosynthesis anti-sigma factor FlgM
MATTPVNNTKLQNPLLAGKAMGAGKAKAADASGGVVPAATNGAGAGATAGGKKGDADYGVQISSDGAARAVASQKAYDIAKATPDVRQDRVAALKAQIDAGTYQIDSGKIADGMMHEAIKDHLAESGR